MPVFALWSPPRARSTAFFRSMVERGDMLAVHEPFSDVTGLGETDVDGQPFESSTELLRWFRDHTSAINVFVKDTPNDRLRYLLDDAYLLREAKHAFLIRRPDQVAASFYAIEQNMRIDSIGLEFLHTLFTAVVEAGGHQPVVVDSDDLVDRPEATMAAYCAAVGLPFIPEALSWEPGERHEWRRSARWHADAAASSGFERRERRYEHTVVTSPELARFAAHHQPFYDRLAEHRLHVPIDPDPST